MAAREKIVCDCGGEITRPIPSNCPHCGAQIVGTRKSVWSWLQPVLIVGALFVALIAGLYLLVSRL